MSIFSTLLNLFLMALIFLLQLLNFLIIRPEIEGLVCALMETIVEDYSILLLLACHYAYLRLREVLLNFVHLYWPYYITLRIALWRASLVSQHI